jgi:hypothetical protein
MRVEGRVTAILPVDTRLIVGDSNGRLRSGGSSLMQVGEEGQPVAAILMQSDEIWAVAGSTVARYKLDGLELTELSKYPNVDGEIYNLVSLDGWLFSVVGDTVRRMGPQGPAEGGFKVRKDVHSLGHTYDNKFLVVVTDAGAVLLDPATLTPVATAPVDKQLTIVSIGCPPHEGRFYLGTRGGQLLQFTFQ